MIKEKFMYKIWRSPYSYFAGTASDAPDEFTDETITAQNVYTDSELKRISAEGFNGIWVHALLHHVIHADPLPELGIHSQDHLNALRKLITRAAQYDLKVFLYMQPPRAIEQSNTFFWDKYRHLGGCDVVFGENVHLRTLCTSLPEVKEYLRNAASKLAEELPDLGGVMMITESEFPSHCRNVNSRSSHECPRCAKRETAEVIAGIINRITEGIRSKSDMAVIAWNWGWELSGLENIIRRLSREVIVMGDFERHGFSDIPEFKHFQYTEYSLAYPGPCEAFLETEALTRKYGLRLMAKLQLGTTHELSTVRSLPAVESIRRKALYLRTHSIAGFVGCWNFGNFPGLNVRAFQFFLRNPEMDDFIAEYFPKADRSLLLDGWKMFQDAMSYFPNTIPVLYYGPQNHTLADTELFLPGPLRGGSAGGSWLDAERGDDYTLIEDLPGCGKLFSLDEIIERFGKTALLWQTGCRRLKEALQGHYELEYGNAVIAGAAFKSTENTLRLYRLRKNWRPENVEWFRRILENELEVLREVLPFLEADPEQGYHGEAGMWMFSGEKVREKIRILQERKETV